MDSLTFALSALCGGAVGFGLGFFLRRREAAEAAARAQSREKELSDRLLAREEAHARQLREETGPLLAERARLEETLRLERESAREKLSLLDEAKGGLSNLFQTLSSSSLQANNKLFLELAEQKLKMFTQGAQGDLEKRQTAIEQLVKPVRESLDKFQTTVQGIEKDRAEAYSELKTQVGLLQRTQLDLRTETGNLVRALRAPQVRGRWGELQLRRVVELAGMLNYCDFLEQQSASTEEGALRPDLVVKLPGGKQIVVDAKAVIEAYIDACQESDETVKKQKLQLHARHVRDRVTALSRKAYWEQFEASPEFVVLFLPGESFFSAALEQDPSLIEQSVDQRVIIATPTTLIALLKAVAYGWNQVALAENARQISELGRELHERVTALASHFADVGRKLSGAVDSYNKAVGSLETRVLVSTRRFRELSVGEGELESPAPIEKMARELQAPELRDLPLGQQPLL